MVDPYYTDDTVTLYHGDCREVVEWLHADVLVTDPPYGRAWKQGQIEGRGAGRTAGNRSESHGGITNDTTTDVRDAALALWGVDRPAVAFGDLMLTPPASTKLVAIYRKPPDAGVRGAIGGLRRDVEAVYLIGAWPSAMGGRTSCFATSARTVGNPTGLAARYGHPHAKPVDVMEDLVGLAPGAIADPFAGCGSTLVAAKLLGRKAIGVELDERYCEITANRLSQGVLNFEGVVA